MVGHGRIGNDHGHVDLEVRSLHCLSPGSQGRDEMFMRSHTRRQVSRASIYSLKGFFN